MGEREADIFFHRAFGNAEMRADFRIFPAVDPIQDQHFSTPLRLFRQHFQQFFDFLAGLYGDIRGRRLIRYVLQIRLLGLEISFSVADFLFAQIIQRQIFRRLIQKWLWIIDVLVFCRIGHFYIRFLSQVLGGLRATDHAAQNIDQRLLVRKIEAGYRGLLSVQY